MHDGGRADRRLCAVVGCENEGQPFACIYDGGFHRHGRIHYNYVPSELLFREGWHLVCFKHYEFLRQELRKHAEEIGITRTETAGP
jgi:hypothetical protein